ncbi:hypothetical protein FRB94_002833 [Tulasnella sp. JGI-2019a]|nr:hypothetical protein FRB94_002833 [Tulasnella sp. JGI-2019a]KAG8995059.1 hypothetical protein FRB93_001249 [Tulasnella sp. JGI-2019a]KAG9022476.1 hypothetical protein FRB95_014733 [Tulasnella sp. JGI-2019a]
MASDPIVIPSQSTSVHSDSGSPTSATDKSTSGETKGTVISVPKPQQPTGGKKTK